MISKFIKNIFGKKEKTAENPRKSNTPQSSDDGELTNDKNPIDFDLMADKTFVYHESAYRHQEIVVRRATEDSRLALGEVLSQLFDEKISSVRSMAVAYRLAECGNELSESIIEGANEVWDYDLFSCILKRKVDGHYSMGMYHETTLIINCTSRRYIMTLTSLGGIDTVKYMRATLLVPDNKQTDDGMSLKTENAPVSISFILSYSEMEVNPAFEKYEQIENGLKRKKTNDYDELEKEFIHGQFEFQGYEYIGYGKWLFEQNRYYDAFSILERAFNHIRSKKLDTQNQNLMSAYYDICNIMGHCLSKMDREDEASYYYKQGGSELAKCRKRRDELFSLNSTYSENVTIGTLLNTLLGLNTKNIAPCMFVYDVNSNQFLERAEDADRILNTEINIPEQRDRIFVLSCHHVHYKTEEDEDKSILCSNAPLIISTHAIKGNQTTAVMRVDIVRCNFANNDNKREFTKINAPLTFSVCLGSSDHLTYATDNESLLAAIRKVIDYTDKRRFFEAYQLAKWTFECTSNRMKSPDGTDYASNDRLLWEVFFEASYRIGFCLMEMNKMNAAAFYLEIASNSGQYLHVQEYINFLSNTKDPEVISFVESVMEKSPRPEDERGLEEWHFHMAFLKRRKAFALIEEARYEEAEAYITEELLNDPLCKDFALRELNCLRVQLGGR